MYTEISLEGLEFYAYHGYYKHEQETGNKYSLDIKVAHDPINATDELESTIDYEQIYKIVTAEMRNKFKLLETIAHTIIEHIYAQFPAVIMVEVSVSKFNPPLGGICERAKVVIKKHKENGPVGHRSTIIV